MQIGFGYETQSVAQSMVKENSSGHMNEKIEKALILDNVTMFKDSGLSA